MKQITARAVGLALALFVLTGIFACTWPQVAFAANGYRAETLNSDKLFNDGYYLTLLQESNGVSWSDLSEGKIVELGKYPGSVDEYGGMDTKNYRDAEKYCMIWPGLVNNGSSDEGWQKIGGNKEAFAFVSTNDAANNGAAGAEFTITWKKAAILRSTNSSIESDATLSDGSIYVDIKMRTKLINTINSQNVFGATPDSAVSPKYIFQFTNRFDWGFFTFGATRFDQTYTFLESSTGKEVPLNGKLSVLGTSMDNGEGFAIQGASGGQVSNTAPVINPLFSLSSGVYENTQWHTVPGSYVYEIDENGWLGYIGSSIVAGTNVVPQQDYQYAEWYNGSVKSINYVDSKYDSSGAFTMNGKLFPTDATAEDIRNGEQTNTYQWRAAAVQKEMNGASSITVRQYAIGYSGWPNQTGVDDLSVSDAGTQKRLGFSSNNQVNPSYDTEGTSWKNVANNGRKYFTMAFSGLYGSHPGAPVKTVQNHSALKIGDTVSFSIAQHVNEFGNDLFSGYNNFSIYDKLDANLEYKSAKLFYIAPGSSNKVDVTSKAGKLSFAESSNTVTYAFSKNYLNAKTIGTNTNATKAMVYQGGTYVLEITATVASDKKALVHNTGYSNINGIEKKSEEVDVVIDTAKLKLSKSVRFENAVGDEATYTLELENIENGSIARNVVVEDTSLPAKFEAVAGSQKMSDVPAKVTIRKVADGTAATEEVANNASISLSGNALKATIPYLPSGNKVSLSFKVKCLASFNGKETFNKATAKLDNPAEGASSSITAKDGLWINSAKLSLLKRANAFEYRVGDTATYTLSLSNTEAGTIAKNVVITDSAMPNRVKVDYSSIKVTGVPTQIKWPLDGNGEHREETRANNYTLANEGNGFKLTIPYLPANTLVTITYNATCTTESNGLETMNTATARLDNPTPGNNEEQSRDGIWTNDAQLTLSKEVDEYETQVADVVHYTLVLENIASGTVAKDVVVNDITLPSGLVLLTDTVALEGLPEKVEYPIDGEGQHKAETRANKYGLETKDNGFTFNIDYLPAGIPLTVHYDAVPSEDVNGDEIINTASAYCKNMLNEEAVESEALIWINTPILQIEKTVAEPEHEYSPGDVVTYHITTTNTAPGTIAREIEVTDTFQQEGMQLIRSSVMAFDTDGNQINEVTVSQKLASADFSVATHNDLVCTTENYGRWYKREEVTQELWNPSGQETQSKIILEFQAIVTSSTLAGTTVENTASTTASNATGVEDTAEIHIKADPEQSIPAKLKVRHIDEAGPVLDMFQDTVEPGPYSTTVKEFEGYEFAFMGKDSAPATGEIEAGEEVEVVYVYRKTEINDTPDPTPTPDPQPDPDPEPEPKPTPDPVPEPTPALDPEPKPVLDPEPEPKPEPEPNPEKDPDPTPSPQPDPQPSSDPKPSLEQSPTPSPDPSPAKQNTPSASEETPRNVLAKTGDYLSTHPFVTVLMLSGITLMLSYWATTTRRTKARKRGRKG